MPVLGFLSLTRALVASMWLDSKPVSPWPWGPCCPSHCVHVLGTFPVALLAFWAVDSSSGLECSHLVWESDLLIAGWSSSDPAPESPDLSLSAVRGGPSAPHTIRRLYQGLSLPIKCWCVFLLISGCIVLLRSRQASGCLCRPRVGAVAWAPRKAGAESERPSCHRPGHLSSSQHSLKFLQ